MFRNLRTIEFLFWPTCTNVEDIKCCIFLCHLHGTFSTSVGIDHKNSSIIMLNLDTPQLKTENFESVTN